MYHMSYNILPIIILLLFKYLVEPNIKSKNSML